MYTSEVISKIEQFAPLSTQEIWDASGWQIELGNEVKKVLLCLTVTDNVIQQAIEKNIDLIISHHPLFDVPLRFKNNFSIYSAHTNLDKAIGGTTDTLIEKLGFDYNKAQKIGDFLRLIVLDEDILLVDFIKRIKDLLLIDKLSVVNNYKKQYIKSIAFCAGSGADFTNLAEENFADILITGDIKFHRALESKIILMDLGHFETEIWVLDKLKKLLDGFGIEVVLADEKTPFIIY